MKYPRCKKCRATGIPTYEWFGIDTGSEYHAQHLCFVNGCFDSETEKFSPPLTDNQRITIQSGNAEGGGFDKVYYQGMGW